MNRLSKKEILEKLEQKRGGVYVNWQRASKEREECGKKYAEVESEVMKWFDLMNKLDVAYEMIRAVIDEDE